MNHTLKSLEEVFGDVEGGAKAALDRANIRPLMYDPFNIGESVYAIDAAEFLADLRVTQIEQAREEVRAEAKANIEFAFQNYRFRT